jgi:hypothetical protein
MSRKIRILGVALLTVGLTTAVGTAAAGAFTKKKVHGDVTIAYEKNATAGTDRFFGVVRSPNPRCVRAAEVNLGFKPAFEGGGGSDIPRTTVASTHSDAAGNWEILYRVTPNPAYDFQSYSASSPVRTLKTHRKNVRLVCKFMTSEVLTLFPG